MVYLVFVVCLVRLVYSVCTVSLRLSCSLQGIRARTWSKAPFLQQITLSDNEALSCPLRRRVDRNE